MSTEARAALESARTENGQFGVQPHSAPTRSLGGLNAPIPSSVETVAGDVDDPDFEGADEETTTVYEIDDQFASTARRYLGVTDPKAEVVVTKIDSEYIEGFTVETNSTVYVECGNKSYEISTEQTPDPMGEMVRQFEMIEMMELDQAS